MSHTFRLIGVPSSARRTLAGPGKGSRLPAAAAGLVDRLSSRDKKVID